MVASCPVDKSRLMAGEFKTENEFITIGLKHIKFFTLNGRNISSTKGLFGSCPTSALLCMAQCFQSKILVTGDTNGNLLVWSGRNATKAIKAHNGAVWSLMHDSNLLYSGGQDGLIKIYSQQFEVKETIDMTKMTPFNPGVRSIDINTKTKNMLIATRGGDVILFFKIDH